MEKQKYDFSGWATRNNLRCSDGRIISRDAFKVNDGTEVPMVWNHRHDDPSMVIGHALLENRPQGVYAYGCLNNTPTGQTVREILRNNDVKSLSIYANQLVQNGDQVVHGNIREVSLVLAGANPGAFIEQSIRHGIELDDEAVIYNGEDIFLYHADDEDDDPEEAEEDEKIEETETDPEEDSEEDPEDNDEQKEEDMPLQHADNAGRTVGDVLDSMTEEQKNVMYAIIGQALEDAGVEVDEEGNTVKHNVFDSDENYYEGGVLTHSDMEVILEDGRRMGSLKDSVLAHAEDYGIQDIDMLFPDYKTITNTPEFIKRRTEWVATVWNAVKKTPFSRIKSMFADITEDDARAKGYMKGKLKKEEVFSLLKRTTDPQTVYKKQKLDRDDVIDITDFDVVAWIKGEMRLMLDEELSRAILIGDGRLASSDDKISEDHIRPIWTDEELFTINPVIDADTITTVDDQAKQFIRTAVKSRKDYQGAGNPTLFTTEDTLTDMLLLEDKMGRPLYDTVEKLATAMRVSNIVTVPVMENQTREVSGKHRKLMGIIVNLSDYTIGADRGGAVSMFDDFDIDYNQQKYLIETRCSGALITPFSAIAIELESTSDFQ